MGQFDGIELGKHAVSVGITATGIVNLTFSGTTPLKSTNAVVILAMRVSMSPSNQETKINAHVEEAIGETLGLFQISISFQPNPCHDLMGRPCIAAGGFQRSVLQEDNEAYG